MIWRIQPEAQNLPYLQAGVGLPLTSKEDAKQRMQIKEAYRYHSSIRTNLPCVIPKDGLTIRGHYFAEGLYTFPLSIV